MRHVTWYRLLAVGVLAAPMVSRAQAPQPKVPAAKVRELATIEGDVSGFVRLPSGRALIYSIGDRTFTYDIATKRRTLLGTDMYPASVSPQGDRFAFFRSSEDRTGRFVWTMPIDPKTGTATGHAQRVSLRPEGSGNARFSPDGKMLAFRAGLPSDSTWDITVVPATGGAEHVVAKYAHREAFDWTADGKSLYVELGRSAGQTVIERVPVGGGRREALFPRTHRTNTWVVGVSPDARVAIFQRNPDRFFFRTVTGAEGEIAVALPPLDDGWGHDFSLDSTRYTTMTQVQNQRVRVLNLATGQARDLLPGNVQSSAPAWSPDGRRLAVLTGNHSHYEITVVNADGSSPRRYPVPMHLDGWTPPRVWDNPWSPDGRFLAFRAKAGRENVGWALGDRAQLAVLDVNSGQTRVLATSGKIGNFVWRADGKAIRTIMDTSETMDPHDPKSRWRIVEIRLNGPERLLREIKAEFPGMGFFAFRSDREVVVGINGGKERFLVPLDGGAARRLPDPGTAEPGLRMGGTKVAGKRVLIAQWDGRVDAAQVITILSTVGDSTRKLRLPFSTPNIVVLPDGKQVVSVGKATGDSVYKLFLGPLDGGATRLIGEIPRGTGGALAPSPDGKLLAYTSDGRVTSKIHEVDFGPALQAIVKR